MKNLWNVYCFELGNYFKSKSYMLSTILICVVAVVALSIPGIISDFSGEDSEGDGSDSQIAETIAIYDATGMIQDEMIQSYGKTEIQRMDSGEKVKEAVESEKAAVGFAVTSLEGFDYYVLNKSIYDSASEIFSDIMSTSAKMAYCEEHNLDYEEMLRLDQEHIVCNENVLGKDSENNYWYSYILVILIFMIIVMYGMMIATGVANEKSNRTVEVLVTSTSPASLLFGKVFAGATAILFQIGLIFASLLGGYKMNKDSLGGMLDIIFDIPTDVLVTFAVFGLGGFLIYAFMYGTLGALVSKVEDLNKSAGTAQMLVMVIYFLVLFQMQEPDGIVIKVLSYLPVSSYSAMFIRIAMGSVAVWEVVISAVILYASVIGMGFAGAKIFRNSTLRYGNPIKLTNAIKGLRSKE
ncbi:MAG: ABC transporter permease [Roseburia sp.]|nr:ABC transporter permease [Roseburia sp.]